MDHIVYVDSKAKELEKLVNGSKTMVIRGATGRKLPYGKVTRNDCLYFIRNNGEGTIQAKAEVIDVLNTDKMEKEESIRLVKQNQDKLQLSDLQFNRWAGKRYLVLIEVENVCKIDPQIIDRSAYGNMDDWLPVGDINAVLK